MKHIEIYAHGAAFSKLGSGFAIILLSLNNRWERSFASGNYNANSACLMAVKFGLLSIANAAKNTPIKIFVTNKYIIDMFIKDNDGYYKCTPNANKEIIDEIRLLTSSMNVEISKGDNKEVANCKQLVEDAVKNNSPVDNRK